MYSDIPARYLKALKDSHGEIGVEEIANMPWPTILALNESKGMEMSWAEFQSMIAKKRAEGNREGG